MSSFGGQWSKESLLHSISLWPSAETCTGNHFCVSHPLFSCLIIFWSYTWKKISKSEKFLAPCLPPNQWMSQHQQGPCTETRISALRWHYSRVRYLCHVDPSFGSIRTRLRLHRRQGRQRGPQSKDVVSEDRTGEDVKEVTAQLLWLA